MSRRRSRQWSLTFAHNHPVSAGLTIGIAGAGLSILVGGVMGTFALPWPLLLLMLLGFRQVPAFQAALCLPVALTGAFFLHHPPGAVLLPCAAAILFANLLVRTESVRLWSAEHFAFGLAASLAYGVTAMLTQGAAAGAWLLLHAGTILGVATVAAICLTTLGAFRGARTASEFGTVSTRRL